MKIHYRELYKGDFKSYRPRMKRRECLSCGKVFTSVGFGNRLCDRCRARNNRLASLPVVRKFERLGYGRYTE